MRIKEVSGGQFHWLMRQAGVHRGAPVKAEDDARFSNVGYGVVMVGGKAVGLVTRYDYDNPRYFVDNVDEPVESVPHKFGAPALKCVTLPQARRAIGEVVLPRKQRVEIAVKDALSHPVYGPEIAKALADIEAGRATFS